MKLEHKFILGGGFLVDHPNAIISVEFSSQFASNEQVVDINISPEC